jgi:hypothetical protein
MSAFWGEAEILCSVCEIDGRPSRNDVQGQTEECSV